MGRRGRRQHRIQADDNQASLLLASRRANRHRVKRHERAHAAPAAIRASAPIFAENRETHIQQYFFAAIVIEARAALN